MLRHSRQQWTHPQRGWVLTESTVEHVATGCMLDVWEFKEVWQEWHRVLCAEVEGERQLMSFALKMLS